MSNSNQPASKKPTHVAYHVREGQGDKSYWTRIGAAWPHKDGDGYNIRFDITIRPDTRLVLRKADARPDAGAATEG